MSKSAPAYPAQCALYISSGSSSCRHAGLGAEDLKGSHPCPATPWAWAQFYCCWKPGIGVQMTSGVATGQAMKMAAGHTFVILGVRRGRHAIAAPSAVTGRSVQVAARDDAAHVAVLVHHAQVAQPQRHKRRVRKEGRRLLPAQHHDIVFRMCHLTVVLILHPIQETKWLRPPSLQKRVLRCECFDSADIHHKSSLARNLRKSFAPFRCRHEACRCEE